MGVEPSTILAPSATASFHSKVGSWTQRTCLGPFVFVCLFVCLLFGKIGSSSSGVANSWRAGKLHEVHNYCHKLGNRRGLICVRHYGCVISFHPSQHSVGRGCTYLPWAFTILLHTLKSYCKNLQVSSLALVQACMLCRLGSATEVGPVRQPSTSERWKLGDIYTSFFTFHIGVFYLSHRVPLWD